MQQNTKILRQFKNQQLKYSKTSEIGENEDVLDLECGTGHLTRKIRSLTKGKVVGINPSEGMIKEAVGKSRGFDMVYEVKSAEDMDYEDSFDVIFCNSAFQWFKDPEKAIKNCHRALRRKWKDRDLGACEESVLP